MPAMRSPPLHTERMRARILTILESDHPAVTPAARAAAAAALSDPASLSDEAISELSEALARVGAQPDSGNPPDPAS